MHDFVFPGIIALLASLFCIWLLYPLAIRIGLVDSPSHRKLHQDDIPLIGGIAIFFGFNFSLLHLHYSLEPFRSMIAGGALLILMGVVDDFHDLSAKLRLFGQVLVALVLTSWGGVMLHNVGNLFFLGELQTGLWAMPLTIFVVVAYLNAFNMIDGQDGLAGTVALSQLIWLFLFAEQLGLMSVQALLFVLMASILIFLIFNLNTLWQKTIKKIFLGDAGSTFIAFILAWVAIDLSQVNPKAVSPVALLWVMALPIFDLISVMIHRASSKRSLFSPGRDHLHHVLQHINLPQVLSSGIIAMLSFCFGGIGYLFNSLQLSSGYLFVFFIVTLIIYLFVLRILRAKTTEKVNLSIESELEKIVG